MRRKSLAEERPDLLSQWDPNNELSPSSVTCGSHKKVSWICNNGHIWKAVVKNRVQGSGCPYCEHRAVLKGYNDFQTAFPELVKSWSPKNPIKPSEVSSKSNTEVLWVCENGHEWKARVADRTDGHGCPYCAGQRVWKGFNDLATTHPDLIPEWSIRNKDISPEKITYKNRTNVWWHCPKCGNDYQAVVYSKANGRICPFCIANGLKQLREMRLAKKKIAKDFTYLLPQLATIFYAGRNGLKIITNTETFIGLPVTTYLPDIGLIVDVCSSSKEIKLKEYICSIRNIKYVSLSERLPEAESIRIVRKAFTDAHIHLLSDPIEDLETIRNNYSHWKLKD